MAALRRKEETPTHLVYETTLAQRLSNLGGIVIFIVALLILFSAFTSNDIFNNPVILIFALLGAYNGLSAIFNAMTTTTVSLDTSAHLGTRVTSLLRIPLRRQEISLDRVRQIIVVSRVPRSMNRQVSSRGTQWQLALESTDSPPLVVNWNGTYDEMLAIGHKIGAFLNRPVVDAFARARADQAETAPQYPQIENFGGGGTSTYAPPVAAPSLFGGGMNPASKLPEKTPPPNMFEPDSPSDEHKEFEAAAREEPMAPATPPLATSDTTMPQYSAPPALELPDQPPLASMSDSSTLSASTQIPDVSAEHPPAALPVRPRSLEELKQAVAEDPTDSQSQYQLARYYHSRGALNQALPLYENSARLDPLSAAAQNDLGVLYMQRGDFRSAETALRRAAGLDPFSVNSHYNLGLLLARTGRRKDAEQEFARAQQNARNDAEAQLAANALRGRLSVPMLAS